MQKPNILIIDDDDALCESIKDSIELEGYIVDTSHTAKEGIKKVKNKFYNIVLLDKKLPDLHGLKVLDEIKEISLYTEVIFFTAFVEMDTVIAAMDKGAFSFIPKPFDMPFLIATIHRAKEKQKTIFENRALYKQTIAAEKEWEDTFDSISEMITIQDKDLNIIKCNKAVTKKLNLKRKEIIGKKCYEIFNSGPDSITAFACAKCLKELKPHKEEIQDLITGDFFQISSFPIIDTEGQVSSIVNISRNITDRKRYEDELKESEERFRNTFNMAGVGIAHVSLNGHFLRLNERCCEILGHSEGEIMRLLTSQDITHSNELSNDIEFEKMLLAGEIKNHSMEKRLVKKDGTITWINITVSLVQGTDGKSKYFIFILKDISKRKQDEIQIKNGIEKMKKTLAGTITALSLTVEQRDPYTAGHQRRVGQLACAIADEIGLSRDQIEGIHMAGIVHDIGKMHIPAEILSRPGKLTKDEFNIVRSHAQVGYDILGGIEFSWPVAAIVHQHHEHIDGSGYPQGLSDGDILMEARILCVADVVEAMASHRPYRPALGMEKALEEISRGQGTHYDSDVVNACLRVIKEKGFEFE